MLAVQGATYRLELVVPAEKVAYPAPGASDEREASPSDEIELRHLAADGRPLRAKVYDRATLRQGHRIVGPAVVREPLSTTVVLEDQVASIGAVGEIIIESLAGVEDNA
jgi:N-methylhydantoinase A